MDGNAVQSPNSGPPKKSVEPLSARSAPQSSSSRPQVSNQTAQRSRTPSILARQQSTAPKPKFSPTVKEELWFGGHDNSVAESNAARSMAALVGRIVGAKPFPESARRLADLTRSEVVRIEPIVQVLERDPALSARLLRLVNSAGYALRQRCTSVRHAATLVGTDRLHQIATTAAVLDLFDSRSEVVENILEHSTVTGAICRYLGAHLSLPVDDLFTAGFLHDIGKLMLLETEGDQYFELLSTHSAHPDVIHVAERALYGFDHAVLAAHVLSEWNIPDPVPKLVAWHHDPSRGFDHAPMMAALTQTVRLANVASHALLCGATRKDFAALASSESASYLDISEPQLATMWDDLQTLCEKSVEQCRNENAPALDPRSLRPRQSMGAPTLENTTAAPELPLQFPCVVCNAPTFGNTCRACGGNMCPEHHSGRDEWCTLCARDYNAEQVERSGLVQIRQLVMGATATLLVSAAVGYQSDGIVGSLQASVGTALLLLLGFVLLWVLWRWSSRRRFVHSRPNRSVTEAYESDGGIKSIAPTVAHVTTSSSPLTADPLSELIRLAGDGVEHVIVNEPMPPPSLIARSYGVGANASVGSVSHDWEQSQYDDGAVSPCASSAPADWSGNTTERRDSLPLETQHESAIPAPASTAQPGPQPDKDPTLDSLKGADAESPSHAWASDASRVQPVPSRNVMVQCAFYGGVEASAIEQGTASPSTPATIPPHDEQNQTDRLDVVGVQHRALQEGSEARSRPHPLAAIATVAQQSVLHSRQSGSHFAQRNDCALSSDPSLQDEPLVGATSMKLRDPSGPSSTARASTNAAEPDCVVTLAPDPPESVAKSEPSAAPQVSSQQPNEAPDVILARFAAELLPDPSTTLGQQFKARVLELAAQRVAEMVAARFMQTFESSDSSRKPG